MGVIASSVMLALAAPAPAAATQGAVPFDLTNGRIYVQAFVNGKGPYRFGFDTGASGIGRADTRLASELGLARAGETEHSDGVAVTTSDVVTVDSVTLGPLTARNAELVSRDYNKRLKPGEAPMMGIIGRDFFAGKTVAIDYPARTIRFTDARLDPGEPGVVRYGPSFAIPVCFASLCRQGKVDTGSNRGLVVPKDLAETIADGPPTALGGAARTNSSVSLYEVKVRGPVTVGAISAKVDRVLYAEPSTDTVNVGTDFLKDYVLTIDSRSELLRLEPAGNVR